MRVESPFAPVAELGSSRGGIYFFPVIVAAAPFGTKPLPRNLSGNALTKEDFDEFLDSLDKFERLLSLCQMPPEGAVEPLARPELSSCRDEDHPRYFNYLTYIIG